MWSEKLLNFFNGKGEKVKGTSGTSLLVPVDQSPWTSFLKVFSWWARIIWFVCFNQQPTFLIMPKRKGGNDPNDEILSQIAKVNAKRNVKKRIINSEINQTFSLVNKLKRAQGSKFLEEKTMKETRKLPKNHPKLKMPRGVSDSSNSSAAASEPSISSVDSQVLVCI